jgi:glycosyltransferase involved in cell wall biosynthesis
MAGAVPSGGVRIVHVSDCYAPRTGGIETQVRALAGRQAAHGDHVRVITATPGHAGVFAGDDVVDGLPVHRVAAHLPFELPVHPRTVTEVGGLLDRHPVDVVHVHAGVVSPFAWGAVRAATRRGIPTLVTVHSVWGPLARPGFGASDALVRWSRWGVTLSAVSAVAAQRVAAAVPRAGEVLVVPNGIDPADWAVEPRGADPSRLRIATVMRMAPRKRTLPLVRVIEAAASQLAPRVQVTATLVGDGPERARAEKYASEHGLAGVVRFTGRLDREGIRAVFAESDVYLQPSVKESFGLAALEGRSAGLPVVARSQTGTTQFVQNEVQGLLADDDDGLARALVRLGHDRPLLERITHHNRTTPPQDAWPHVIEIVRDAYARAGAVAP